MKNNLFQYIRFRDILQDTRQVRFADNFRIKQGRVCVIVCVFR